MAETQIGNAIKNVLDNELDNKVSAKNGIKLLKNLAKDVMDDIKTNDTSQQYIVGDFGKRLNSIDDIIEMRKTINNILVKHKNIINNNYDTYLQFSSDTTPPSYTIDDTAENINVDSVFAGQTAQLEADSISYDAELQAEKNKREAEVTKYTEVITKINEINTAETKVIDAELKLKELEEKLKVDTETNEELDEKINPLKEDKKKYVIDTIEKQKEASEKLRTSLRNKIDNPSTSIDEAKKLTKNLKNNEDEISKHTIQIKKYRDIEKQISDLEKNKIDIKTTEKKINNVNQELQKQKDNKNKKVRELKKLLLSNENILKFIFIAIGKELNEADKMSSLTEDNINEIIKPETLTKIENKKKSLE